MGEGAMTPTPSSTVFMLIEAQHLNVYTVVRLHTMYMYSR